MAKLKFRAECEHDIQELIKLLPSDCPVTIETPDDDVKDFPDREAVIDSNSLRLWQVVELMSTIPDSHVMVETVQVESVYTWWKEAGGEFRGWS